jgi:hypothetical protein
MFILKKTKNKMSNAVRSDVLRRLSKPFFTFIIRNISHYAHKFNSIYARKKTMAFHWQIFTRHKNVFCSDFVYRVSLSLDDKGKKQEYSFIRAPK